MKVVLLASISGLALTGGLAAACFVKVFGVILLGPRATRFTSPRLSARRFDSSALGLGFLAVLCTAISPGSILPSPAQCRVAAANVGRQHHFFRCPPAHSPHYRCWRCLVWARCSRVSSPTQRGVRRVPTWTCGSPVDRTEAQYTATAFAKPLRTIFAFLLLPERHRFPRIRSFPTGFRRVFAIAPKAGT